MALAAASSYREYQFPESGHRLEKAIVRWKISS